MKFIDGGIIGSRITLLRTTTRRLIAGLWYLILCMKSESQIIFEIADAYGYSKSNINCGLSTDYNFKAYRPKDMSMDCQKFEKAFDIELVDAK